MVDEQPPRPPSEKDVVGGVLPESARQGWHKVLVDGHERLRLAHRLFRHLPSAPRCKLCHNPFGGVGGHLVGLFGFRPSRKNPNLCTRCCDSLPPGGIEVDTAVLFADVRGSTALSERVGPAEFARRMNQFYRTATEVLIRHDAIIDKLIGDEVMAFFVAGISGPDYRRRAALGAVELVQNLALGSTLPVGASVVAGPAFVGNVGADHVVDFTALGDPVNTAARLQAQAGPGEVVLAEDVYGEVDDRFPRAEARRLAVRGRSAPVDVRVVRTTI
ncbi:MAG TPA: adenylate/guanylate cyclase domain-containing protein [Acidimicrobiales bacterium]|jgi:adenylate cyclase